MVEDKPDVVPDGSLVSVQFGGSSDALCDCQQLRQQLPHGQDKVSDTLTHAQPRCEWAKAQIYSSYLVLTIGGHPMVSRAGQFPQLVAGSSHDPRPPIGHSSGIIPFLRGQIRAEDVLPIRYFSSPV